MSCCPYNHNIPPVDIFNIDSTKLCNPCKVEFYRKRFERLGNHSNYTYVKAVWIAKIEELFPRIDPQHLPFLLSSINPPLWDTFNLNESPINLITKIIEVTEKFDVNVSFYLRNLVKDPRVDSLRKISTVNANHNFLDAARKAGEESRKIISWGAGNFFNVFSDKRMDKRVEDILLTTPIPISLVKSLKFTYQSTIPRLGFGVLGMLAVWADRNQPNSDIEDLKYELQHRYVYDKETKQIVYNGITGHGLIIEMKIIRDSIKKLKMGNCNEHAIIAFLYLLENVPDARPVDIIAIEPDHAYVVIGGGSLNEAFFNDSMVVCDAYYDEYYVCDKGFQDHQKSKGKGTYTSRIRVDKHGNIIDHPNPFTESFGSSKNLPLIPHYIDTRKYE